MRKLSRAERRKAERHAAEEFFRRRARPEPQVRQQQQEPAQPEQTPATQVIPDWRESKEILKKLLAEGQIKQSRK